MTKVIEIPLVQKFREDAHKAMRKMRLSCAAQMIAAARELVAGEPGYMERERELETIQHELEDDSL